MLFISALLYVYAYDHVHITFQNNKSGFDNTFRSITFMLTTDLCWTNGQYFHSSTHLSNNTSDKQYFTHQTFLTTLLINSISLIKLFCLTTFLLDDYVQHMCIGLVKYINVESCILNTSPKCSEIYSFLWRITKKFISS